MPLKDAIKEYKSNGSNGVRGSSSTSRRRSPPPPQPQRVRGAKSPAIRRRSPPPQQPQQRRQLFNSTRTAWVLSLLLIITLITQVILISYHDEFVMRLKAIEGELLEDASLVNLMASDALNAAYEYNEGEGDKAYPETARDQRFGPAPRAPRAAKGEILNAHAAYSMEPADILRRAGVDVAAGFVPSITVGQAQAAKKSSQNVHERKVAALPSLEDIQMMYSNRTHIAGLDRCREFRQKVPPERRLMGPAGIFNSATNLLNKLLKLNCVNKARTHLSVGRKAPTGMLLQAPWGKHNPASWRFHHEAAAMWDGVPQEDFLPIVMIKDPITWMASMCRHSYEARWRHTNDHCPNLVPNEFDKGREPGKGTMGLRVKFATKHFKDDIDFDRKKKTFVEYNSLVDLWNTWYKEWHDVDFPRIMVRFEDLLFHAEETVSQICKCGGGAMKPRFRYVEDSAKGDFGPHAGSAGFLASLINYGNRTLRMEGILTDENDAEYARKHLDKHLMDLFGYAPI